MTHVIASNRHIQDEPKPEFSPAPKSKLSSRVTSQTTVFPFRYLCDVVTVDVCGHANDRLTEFLSPLSATSL